MYNKESLEKLIREVQSIEARNSILEQRRNEKLEELKQFSKDESFKNNLSTVLKWEDDRIYNLISSIEDGDIETIVCECENLQQELKDLVNKYEALCRDN